MVKPCVTLEGLCFPHIYDTNHIGTNFRNQASIQHSYRGAVVSTDHHSSRASTPSPGFPLACITCFVKGFRQCFAHRDPKPSPHLLCLYLLNPSTYSSTKQYTLTHIIQLHFDLLPTVFSLLRLVLHSTGNTIQPLFPILETQVILPMEDTTAPLLHSLPVWSAIHQQCIEPYLFSLLPIFWEAYPRCGFGLEGRSLFAHQHNTYPTLIKHQNQKTGSLAW